mgnify:CR=1 FL=1
MILFFLYFREAHIVNIKHHWWWKLNFLKQYFSFDHLVLLEEDHALGADSIQMMENMEKLKCERKECDLMSLGHYKYNLKLGDNVSQNFRNNLVFLPKMNARQKKMDGRFLGNFADF